MGFRGGIVLGAVVGASAVLGAYAAAGLGPRHLFDALRGVGAAGASSRARAEVRQPPEMPTPEQRAAIEAVDARAAPLDAARLFARWQGGEVPGGSLPRAGEAVAVRGRIARIEMRGGAEIADAVVQHAPRYLVRLEPGVTARLDIADLEELRGLRQGDTVVVVGILESADVDGVVLEHGRIQWP